MKNMKIRKNTKTDGQLRTNTKHIWKHMKH